MVNDIRVEDPPDVEPVCPYCGEELKAIGARRVETTLGVRFLYFCLSCRRALGVSHRKGFWMG